MVTSHIRLSRLLTANMQTRGTAPVSDWKLLVSWAVITTLGWALILALLIAVFWLFQ